MDPKNLQNLYPDAEQHTSVASAPSAPQESRSMPGKLTPPKSKDGSTVNPNSTQNALQIAEIRDGVAIMNDGTFRTIIMCKAINFDLMSPQEREAVEFSYQGFLNSLYFPIQVFVRSQKVDLRPYLEKLNKLRSTQESMLLALLIDDYITYLSAIAQQTNIMDKKFYVIISYPDLNQDVRNTIKQSTGFFTGVKDLFSSNKTRHVTVDERTLETAKTELRNRVQACMQGLLQCGVQSLPLDTEEMIELFYDAYNPDTATHQHLVNFENLTEPIVGKGEGEAPKPDLDTRMN